MVNGGEIVVKYHNHKMLMTLDLNTLVDVLLKTFGEQLVLRFKPMSDEERGNSSDRARSITAVRERFWILEETDAGDRHRRKDIEDKIVREGRK